jgi:hypothetical protein
LVQKVRSERTGRVSFVADPYSSVTKIGAEKADFFQNQHLLTIKSTKTGVP